jgi:hypothetical protein
MCLSTFSDAQNIMAPGSASLQAVQGMFGELWVLENSSLHLAKIMLPGVSTFSFQF